MVMDNNLSLNVINNDAVSLELVRSTYKGGPPMASDEIGTSFAAPKVSHIAARLASEFPDENCLLYRALIAQSARWPEWTKEDNVDKLDVLRQIGYGIPDLDRAIGNSSNRITLITKGENYIQARKAHIFKVKLPDVLRSQGEELDIFSGNYSILQSTTPSN